MSSTRVWLIRHGETDWNAEGRWQGRAPVPLNANGQAQAAALGRYLAAQSTHYDGFYSSPLLRAMQTAQAIAAALAISIQPEPRIAEIDLGDWQGLTRAEVQAWDAQRYTDYDAAWPVEPPPNGESWLQVRERARAGFDDLVAQYAGRTLALVSHGGTIGQLITSLFGDIERPTLTNTSLTLVERADPATDWTLVHVAWAPHLSRNGSLGETW